MTIWLTLDQAADTAGLPLDTLQRAVEQGMLITHRQPVDGHTYVAEPHVLDLERALRTGTHPLPPGQQDRTDPGTGADIVAWLRDWHDIDLGPNGTTLLRQWARRYPALRVDGQVSTGPGQPWRLYDRTAVLAIAQRTAGRRRPTLDRETA